MKGLPTEHHIDTGDHYGAEGGSVGLGGKEPGRSRLPLAIDKVGNGVWGDRVIGCLLDDGLSDIPCCLTYPIE